MVPAVKFEDVYKEYPFYQHITAGFKSFLFNLPKNIASLRRTKFAALKGVTFEVAKGETFGIIGKNGSGKSTTLGLIAGVIRPDRGSVEVSGKISSLLELGAGFHPDLSGIENIILNGILMGNTKEEMLKKIDEIIEFSELGDFIYQPLRTYSSGMQVRLGFSVAVHVDPELLVIDEALAVGDLNFQEKCLKKMREFRESGATIILVSHGMSAIAKLCDRAAWLDAGEVMAVGKPKEVIGKYLRHIGQEAGFALDEENSCRETGEGDREVRVRAEGGDETASVAPVHDNLTSTGADREEQEVVSAESPPSRASWWESITVLDQCVIRITGGPHMTFYDFLKRDYFIRPFEKGVSICNRLKGMERDFIVSGICRSFDVVNDEEQIALMGTGRGDFKRDYYDLFLCVDFLHRVENLDAFLKHVDNAVRENGFVIAIEYVGPAHFRWSAKEISIAETLYAALDGGDGGSDEFPSSIEERDRGGSAEGSSQVIPSIGKFFEPVLIRYFGGPLYDLLLNRIFRHAGPGERSDLALIKTIIQCDRILTDEGILKDSYALVLARKRRSG